MRQRKTNTWNIHELAKGHLISQILSSEISKKSLLILAFLDVMAHFFMRGTRADMYLKIE